MVTNVLKKVMKKVSPTPREEKDIYSALESLKAAVDKNKGKLQYTLAGSFVRNTWMKDKKEFDIFLLFPEFTKRATLERKGLEIGKGVARSLKGSWKIAYAEHPYTRVSFRGFEVDVVPCYKVQDASKIKSSVDRTPFHNQYLAQVFPKELAGEVRLLKQFLKASGLYGSDARTLGFSGYLCELLILHYKSFKNLVKEASGWETGQCIDLENHMTPKQSFSKQPLIVIDPVDPKRNVAAVLSPGNFMRFISLCKSFRQKPGECFFFKKLSKPNVKRLARVAGARGSMLLGIEFKHPGVIDDVLFPQMIRTANRLNSILEEQDFKVLRNDVFSDDKVCMILFELDVWELPNVRKVIGPPVFVKKHAKEFIGKYRKGRILVEGSSWVAEVKRPFPMAEELLKATLKQSKSRLLEAGIASNVAKARKFNFLVGKHIFSKARSPEFYSFLLEFLEGDIPQ